MVPPVHAHLVALGDGAADEVGVLDDAGAEDEERRHGVRRGERVEDPRRPDGIGPVVEGEGDSAHRDPE